MYGADENRVVQVLTSGGVTSRTVYVGLGGTGKSMYERTTTGNTVQHVNFIYAGSAHGGAAFAVRTMDVNGSVTGDRYFNFDHLGSTTAVSDEKGHIANASGADAGVLGYDPWGARRNPDGTAADPASFSPQVGHREFTGQETMPEVGLINMNGRVYDPALARFLSPDPEIQDSTDPQNYNRYSYVINNPLRYTDPTGYSFLGDLANFFENPANDFFLLGSIVACASTAVGCLAFGVLQTVVNIASAADSGASFQQTAISIGVGVGFSFLTMGAVSAFGGGGLASIIAGSVSAAASTAITDVATGHNPGWDVAVSAFVSATSGAITYGLQQAAAVSKASAADPVGEKSGSGGRLSAEQRKIVADLEHQTTGEGVSDAKPLSHADRVKVDAMIARGNMNGAIEYLRATYGLRQGGEVAVQVEDGLYSGGKITIGKTGYSWNGRVSAEWLYATLSHENVHVAQDMFGRLGIGQQHELNEVEAYVHDLRSARAYGLNEAQIGDLSGRLIQHFSLLRQPELPLSGQWKLGF